MGFIYGLAVVLIIFEGVIIKCKGTAPVDATSLNWIQDAPIIEINGDQQFLPNHLIEMVVSYTDFKTAKTTVRSGIVNATNIVMSRILQNRTIVINLDEFDGKTEEYYEEGDMLLKMGSLKGVMSLFDQFGKHVKKINMHYGTKFSLERLLIGQNITKRYANNLEELGIDVFMDVGIWDEMSKRENGIIFPEVKKLKFTGRSVQNEFKLNSMFPKLESLMLIGTVKDKNCLANITTLKELNLRTYSIEEDQLDHIFANNKNMTGIYLTAPRRTETMHAIAKHLTKLERLAVEYPTEIFLFRSNNVDLYKLSSVTHFLVIFREMNDLIGDLSFDMPHLKKLSLGGAIVDNRIINFINYFKELEIVVLLVNNYNPVECIEKLKHIKEFRTNNFESSELNSLRKMLKNFDKTSKLETLKLMNFVDCYEKYEDTMKLINIDLAKSNKSTWTLSQGELYIAGPKYLMFKRDL